MSADRRLTRRAVLLGALAAPLAACRRTRSPRAAKPPAADAAALRSAGEAEAEIVAAYTAAMERAGSSAQSVLATLLDDHRRHLSALGQATVRAAVFDPTSSRELAVAERSTAATFTKAANAVRDGHHAALLASIAASHRAHVDVLTRRKLRW